jgi:hypothetical protein
MAPGQTVSQGPMSQTAATLKVATAQYKATLTEQVVKNFNLNFQKESRRDANKSCLIILK